MRFPTAGVLLWVCACGGSAHGTAPDAGVTRGMAGHASGVSGSAGSAGGSKVAPGVDAGRTSMDGGGASGGGGAGGRGTGGGGAGGGGSGQTGSADAGSSGCFHARRLWFEDFETGDYSRWTSRTYCGGCSDGQHWDGNTCQATALSTAEAHGATHAERSEITCAYTSNGNVHRGYGGLQWNGDQLVPAYTNTGAGIDAPNGVVVTWWVRLDSDTVFANGKWMSFFTAEAECDWSGEVMTLGLEDSSSHLEGAHYQPGGGTRQDVPGSPSLPRHKWVRLTVYINYHDGSMHVWQDGTIVEHMTFFRTLKTICQWHFGLYASGDNDAIVLFEDDFSLWKLDDAWTDFTREPYFDQGVPVCK